MIYGRLIGYSVDYDKYKGETYMRARLTFKILWFKKTIIQDLTMFSHWRGLQDFWEYLIKDEARIPISRINNRKIF